MVGLAYATSFLYPLCFRLAVEFPSEVFVGLGNRCLYWFVGSENAIELAFPPIFYGIDYIREFVL